MNIRNLVGYLREDAWRGLNQETVAQLISEAGLQEIVSRVTLIIEDLGRTVVLGELQAYAEGIVILSPTNLSFKLHCICNREIPVLPLQTRMRCYGMRPSSSHVAGSILGPGSIKFDGRPGFMSDNGPDQWWGGPIPTDAWPSIDAFLQEWLPVPT